MVTFLQFFVACALAIPLLAVNNNPHQPMNLTWVISDDSSEVISATSSARIPGTWFPDLFFDLGTMLHITGTAYYQQKLQFYVCPGHLQGHHKRQSCEDTKNHFCGSWSCVSTGQISWDPPTKNDLITITRYSQQIDCYKLIRRHRGNFCDPIKVSFTPQGKNYGKWYKGAKWGIRLYYKTRRGPLRIGNVFTIKLLTAPLTPIIPVGPNKIPPLFPLADKGNSSMISNVSDANSPSLLRSTTDNPLWNVLSSTFSIVNSTHPEMTQTCWLCFNVLPPYYEAVGLIEEYTTSTSGAACRWTKGTQTLQSLSGQGACIGRVPNAYQIYCNITHTAIDSSVFYIPPPNGWWACSTGVTACAHGSLLNKTDYCILVTLLPRIFYHDQQAFLNSYSDTTPSRQKREPLTMLGIGLLVTLGLVGTGTGIGALAHSYTSYSNLRAAIDEDLVKIESSISLLQASLTSLSEVSLQNRRALHLLFLKDGGLCVALKEECCFYADHSGVVQDSMAKLRESLNKRKAERENQLGWFQRWFDFSPWLTTLISALVGPLTLLLLACIIGPCVINRLVSFIRSRIATLETMIIQTSSQSETISLLNALKQEQEEKDWEEEDALALQFP